jgi:hypothetical protein
VNRALAASILGRIFPASGSRLYALFFTAFYGFYRSMCDGRVNTGMCSGFASRSLQRFWSDPSSRTFDEFPDMGSADLLPQGIRRELTVAHGRLLGYETLNDLIVQCGRGLANVRTSLRNVERDISEGSGLESSRILFFVPSGRIWEDRSINSEFFENLGATHAVVPYRIDYPQPGSTDPIRMFVYDCRHPGISNSFIEFTERADRDFDFRFLPTGDPAHPGFDSADGWTLATMTLRDFLLRDISLPMNRNILDLILSPVELRIRNSRGQLTGKKNGKIYMEIPGSFPLLSCRHAFVLPKGKYTREIKGTGSGKYAYCSFNPDGTSIMLEGAASGGTKPSIEVLEFDARTRKVAVKTNANTKSCKISLRVADDKGIKMATLSGIMINRRKPFEASFNRRLEEIRSLKRGSSDQIALNVMHLPKRRKKILSKRTQISLVRNQQMRVKMSYVDKLTINKI